MRDRATRSSFLVTTAVCVAALVLRNPTAFRLPQFYAEEGRYFFADAYNDGWTSLFWTANGYFHLLPRLLANLSLSVGIPYGAIPAVFVYGCLPFYALLWARIHTRLDLPLAARAALCLATVLVPVGNEVFMSQTNIQWVLAPVPLVLYLGRPASNRAQRGVDLLFLILCCFTGPYALFTVPLIAAHAALTGRLRAGRSVLEIGGAAAVISGISLLRFGTLSRVDGPPESTLFGFAQLTTKTFYAPLITLGVEYLPDLAVVVMALALPVALLAFGRAALRSRNGAALLFLACSLAAFAGTLLSYWRDPALPSPYSYAMRFFYLPVLFLLWALIAASPWERRFAVWWGAVFLWYFVQIPSFNSESMWAVPAPDLRWDRYAARLEQGEALTVPITPLGWDMHLEAKPPPEEDGR